MESAISYVSSKSRSPLGSSDPIAAAIGLLRPRTAVDPDFSAAGPWALRFEAFEYVKIGGIEQGECWLVFEDDSDPVRLRKGDVFLLVNPPAYRLASSPTVEPLPAQALWESAVKGRVCIGTEADEDFSMCGGQFWFDQANTTMLIDVLPRLVHVRAGDRSLGQLAQVAHLLSTETKNRTVGSSLVLDHLVQILFVHVLRAHVDQTDHPAGWLGALSDDGVGAALRALHADISHRWSLQELAGIARMSRSAFAAAFKKQLGTTPGEYLIQWRMSLARDALRRNTRSISELAVATGYESESAFSTAFRRVVGSSPKQYRDAPGERMTRT
ncbi:AraC family transcriptional regulator [Actinoplanes friuliensis]|uniref:AraC family transcriptional regulator n=1 Tax=Actinoplanes friuliensis DSM 7358 TaxID=1246995 RepID=U5VV90_9ACTN|nr:AraC family transcriptional regulator [Actinoplanes friuliensis]AGZ40722.1 AraC family transcriptional regulator [Actinoplanes friuliensis DSM 7358]